jgi:hypothetical protein
MRLCGHCPGIAQSARCSLVFAIPDLRCSRWGSRDFWRAWDSGERQVLTGVTLGQTGLA